MASNYTLPPPPALEIHDQQVAEKWKKFKLAWTNYSLATGLSDKAEPVQVATLLTVIGEEAREVFHDGDGEKIAPVIAKFEQYCQPRQNIPFETYRFNRQSQESGETYDQYRKHYEKSQKIVIFVPSCQTRNYETVWSLVFVTPRPGNAYSGPVILTLEMTDEICRSAESMLAQMKVVEDSSPSNPV